VAAKVESEYLLLGFKDARGETVRTPFREAYEHGGVFLFDELDRSSAGAVTALNMALANGVCPFPDELVKRHKDLYVIGAGNTKLSGASRQYVGAQQMDAAVVDRFAFIHWDYDDDLELAVAADRSWAEYVQAVRAAVKERGITHLVTPRATYDGCRLLAQGFDHETVKGMVVYKGLDDASVEQIEAALPKSKRL
jgi:MoxR-like ATPase